MHCTFTLNHYAEICSLLLNKGYRAALYEEDEALSSQDRVVILRHDVDQSLSAALRVAEVEAFHGLRSTYFVWLRSPFYNVFDPQQSHIVRRIHQLGHRIGLHFDETSYELPTVESFREAVAREAAILAGFFELPVEVVSMHRPSSRVLEQDIRFPGLFNSYSKRFLKEYTYVSDSRREWRQGCICQRIQSESIERLHLLTHAFWWTDEDSGTVGERVSSFLAEHVRRIDLEAEQNISVYRRRFTASIWPLATGVGQESR